MKIKHVDHIGINVEELEAAKEFFVDLGFTVMGEMPMGGELVERVIGLSDVRTDMVMLQAPDGQVSIELSRFHHPVDTKGVQSNPANSLGLRHLAFQVEGIDEFIKMLKNKDIELVGELVNYEDMWKLCYVRGPEGIIIELAERL